MAYSGMESDYYASYSWNKGPDQKLPHNHADIPHGYLFVIGGIQRLSGSWNHSLSPHDNRDCVCDDQSHKR